LNHYLKDKEKEKFLFFNTFFYKSMKKESIHKWTKKVDIFDYDYIFVPINQNLHWKLAIICFAGMVDNASNTDDKYPCILVLDSLGCIDPNISIMIRAYLQNEWSKRKKTTCSFTSDSMKHMNLKVPEQTNYTDCGVYLLRYIEKFCEKPPSSLDIKKLNVELGTRWFNSYEISQMRKRIKDTIHYLQNFLTDHKKLPMNKPQLYQETPTDFSTDLNHSLSETTEPTTPTITTTSTNQISAENPKSDDKMEDHNEFLDLNESPPGHEEHSQNEIPMVEVLNHKEDVAESPMDQDNPIEKETSKPQEKTQSFGDIEDEPNPMFLFTGIGLDF